MNNILCCNAGRRGRLMIDMRKTIGDSGNVVATYGAQNETYIEGWEKKTSKLLIYKRLCKI